MSNGSRSAQNAKSRVIPAALGLVLIGTVAFGWSLAAGRPAAAWRAYLVNFLLFSAIAQGALVFSAMMHTVHAKWSRRLENLAESFAAFFPVSFVLFLGLFFGRAYVFPWMDQDLHGKEVWLNVPFLFSRDGIALLVLYGLGFAYLYYTLWFKVDAGSPATGLQHRLARLWARRRPDPEKYEHRRYVFGVLYLLAFAVVLSLIGFDLVMAAEPHWYSTLFGAYTFIKAIYVGFGALLILAACTHASRGTGFLLSQSEFIDMGKLFFAFCLAWADFFYCQLVVIWYGNIAEETAYVITRTMLAPWNRVAWAVFIVCFAAPFLILLNRRIKAVPWFMTCLCGIVLIGMWLEHYLLLGPALAGHNGGAIAFSAGDVLIFLGFAGLLIAAVAGYLRQFPGMLADAPGKAEQKGTD
ncbi:MAG: hypothetical protein ACLFUY_08770 [Desulfobacterales bacterium]